MGFNDINAGGIHNIQDISDQPLPPLYDQSSVSDVAPISMVPGAGTPTQTSSSDPSPDLPPADNSDGVDTDPAKTRNRRSAAERIAQLTRRYREEQEQRSYAEKVLEEQSRQIAALRQQISNIGPMLQPPAVTPSTPAPEATASDLLTTPDPRQPLTQSAPVPQPALPTALSPDSIRSVLREVIQEQTLQQQKQMEEQRRLMAAHEEAFAMAVEDFPELAQTNSKERALFNELYDKSPIKHLPDAPIQIAFQVKGILADQRGARDVDQAKRQMAGIVPTPTGAAELGESQIATAKKRLAELQERMRRGDNSFDTYKEMRVLRSQLNAARRR